MDSPEPRLALTTGISWRALGSATARARRNQYPVAVSHRPEQVTIW